MFLEEDDSAPRKQERHNSHTTDKNHAQKSVISHQDICTSIKLLPCKRNLVLFHFQFYSHLNYGFRAYTFYIHCQILRLLCILLYLKIPINYVCQLWDRHFHFFTKYLKMMTKPLIGVGIQIDVKYDIYHKLMRWG